MTFAPPTILAVRAFLKGEDADLSDSELGIVGGPSHVLQGTSYHLGRDQLKMSKNPYSARTPRDLAGLSNAASALDVDDDLDELRELSIWCVGECRKGAPDTLDIREIIFSPDGVAVLRWDRERGQTSVPIPDSDTSHRTHTHFDWYRDSEFRDKTALFRRFYQERNMAIDENTFNIQAWRIDAILYDLPFVRGGPMAGERNEPHFVHKEIQATLAEIKTLIQGLSGPAEVDIDELVAELTPAMRNAMRTELNDTKLGKL